MYYSSGNYEAFARPKKPEGVDNKSAYIVGSGLAALTAACYLVRDGQMKGERVHILEKGPTAGGACDGWKFENIGYVMRGGSIIHDTFNLHKLDVLDIMDERIAVLKDLGYTEFIPPTQQGQFRTAAALYCQARRAKDKAACTRLKEKLRILSTVPDLAPGGQYAILCKLTKLTPQAVELYYLIRRICGKS